MVLRSTLEHQMWVHKKPKNVSVIKPTGTVDRRAFDSSKPQEERLEETVEDTPEEIKNEEVLSQTDKDAPTIQKPKEVPKPTPKKPSKIP